MGGILSRVNIGIRRPEITGNAPRQILGQRLSGATPRLTRIKLNNSDVTVAHDGNFVGWWPTAKLPPRQAIRNEWAERSPRTKNCLRFENNAIKAETRQETSRHEQARWKRAEPIIACNRLTPLHHIAPALSACARRNGRATSPTVWTGTQRRFRRAVFLKAFRIPGKAYVCCAGYRIGMASTPGSSH